MAWGAVVPVEEVQAAVLVEVANRHKAAPAAVAANRVNKLNLVAIMAVPRYRVGQAVAAAEAREVLGT